MNFDKNPLIKQLLLTYVNISIPKMFIICFRGLLINSVNIYFVSLLCKTLSYGLKMFEWRVYNVLLSWGLWSSSEENKDERMNVVGNSIILKIKDKEITSDRQFSL
jgi:hypothetical protein